MSNFTFNVDGSNLNTDYFPVIITKDAFPVDLYNELKNQFPDFSAFNTSRDGQAHRLNINVLKDNVNYNKLKEISPLFVALFDYLNSDEFKDKIFSLFTEQMLKNYGFNGDIKTLKLHMQICESEDGYQNPWHVDTRGRIVHGLIYFGTDLIIKGGEIGIAKHKQMDKWTEYPQFPHLKNIEEVKKFKPIDNLGILVLSTPNSYHRGFPLIGKRRFIYIAFNNATIPAWECGWLGNQKSFKHGIESLNKEKREDKNNIIVEDAWEL